MIINATIVNHTLPAVSVNIADGGSGSTNAVTYQQIRNSLGNQVYEVQGLYLYSDNDSQLIGVIKYNRYDVSGNIDITNIVTTIDPYQFVGAIVVDLKEKTNTPIVFNGNSSVATTILPNTYVQVKFLAKRVTNSFGMNLDNFKKMQEITRTNFFNNYGDDIADIQETGKEIRNKVVTNFTGNSKSQTSSNIPITQNDNIPVAFLGIAAVSIAFYIITKRK